MSQYETEEIGFIDETSKDKRTAFRRNGHSAKGEHAAKKGVFVRGHRLSAVGLLTTDGMAACNIVEGSFNAVKFLDFLEHNDIYNFLSNVFDPTHQSILVTTVFTLSRPTLCSCHGQHQYSSQ